MVHAVLLYARERSPLLLTALLSLLLFAAGLHDFAVEPLLFFRGWLSMCLLLFLLRVSDDICDIPLDRLAHPERALCSGRAPLNRINAFRALAVLCLLGLQIGHPAALLLVTLTLVFFSLFFRFKPDLHPLLHTALLDGALGLFPLYAGLLLYGEIGTAQLLMGAFIWLGALAHDYAHSVPDRRDSAVQRLNAITRVEPALLACLSLLLFVLSAGVGLRLACSNGLPWGFLGGLLLMTPLILRLEYRLLRRPCAETAKPFYITGFLFFLVPILGHLGDLAWGYARA
ncbi:MAG: UbiA family prenyltransferase [Pseudomonas sp.]|uniref:UbiA family prenyltransferase n=1 Tax=Pseudomonas sp. TaxID=306 RepID=UPI003392496A